MVTGEDYNGVFVQPGFLERLHEVTDQIIDRSHRCQVSLYEFFESQDSVSSVGCHQTVIHFGSTVSASIIFFGGHGMFEGILGIPFLNHREF